MASPEYELVGTALARLLAFEPLKGLIGASAFYRAPANVRFPYLTVDDTDALRDDAECIAGSDIAFRIHVWTRDGNPLQDARKIAHEVEAALHGHPLPLATNRLTAVNHRQTRVFYDRDGLTGHGIVEFRAIVHAPA